MVKIGFIVEGDSEKIIIESSTFKDFLNKQGFTLITPIINAKGGGNLLPKNIEPFLERLSKAEIICILTDLENENNTNSVRARIQHKNINVIFVAVKALESWYLADTAAMRKLLEDNNFIESNPENTPQMPYEYLKNLCSFRKLRGVGPKPLLAKKMVKNYNFSIENAANHPNCQSAKELIDYFSS